MVQHGMRFVGASTRGFALAGEPEEIEEEEEENK